MFQALVGLRIHLDGPNARARLRSKYRSEAELWPTAQAQAGSVSSLSSHGPYSSE